MLIAIALGDRNTEESIATPCSVKTKGFTDECLRLANRSQFVTSSLIIINSCFVVFKTNSKLQ